MMRVARALVTVLGTVEIVDTPIAHLRKLPGALCMRKEGTSSVQDDAVEQRVLGEEPCEDAVHHFIAFRLVKAGNPENSQSARIDGHEPAVAIWLPFAVRPRLSGVFLVQGVAFHMHLGMAVAHNLPLVRRRERMVVHVAIVGFNRLTGDLVYQWQKSWGAMRPDTH